MVTYEEGSPVAVQFSTGLDPETLSIHVTGNRETRVLGSMATGESGYVFRPLIPFTAGQSYEIHHKEMLLSSFKVASGLAGTSPELLAIYPSKDTVPENLLKVYLQFSQPMQEVGDALQFIEVTDKTTGEQVDIFLPLESELWNKEHDRLTLWLDPGRIKTDLIPNREKGLPLKKGHEYEINISQSWLSASGKPLGSRVKKVLYVTDRDSRKLDINTWKISVPRAGSKGPLRLQFGEAIDAILARETLAVTSPEGDVLEGHFVLSEQEKEIIFTPVNYWKKGAYVLNVDAKLEDIAGNNLSRLFDSYLPENAPHDPPELFHTRRFTIR